MATPTDSRSFPTSSAWHPASRTLSLRLLVSPTGNPLEPLLTAPPGVPAFADAAIALSRAHLGCRRALPVRTAIDQTVDTAPHGSAPNARAIFEGDQGRARRSRTARRATPSRRRRPTPPPAPQVPAQELPAVLRVRPAAHLARRDRRTLPVPRAVPARRGAARAADGIGWGEAIAFSLRRPRLAEALGLIVPSRSPSTPRPVSRTAAGSGWSCAPGGDYAGQATLPDFQRSFATRVPALAAAETRPIFTPVVFPVSDDAVAAAALGEVDRVFVEAVRFDDGFSKIVHARQPLGVDMLDEDGTSASAPRDEGMQLGWDDEDILEGQNRALGAPPDGQNNVRRPARRPRLPRRHSPGGPRGRRRRAGPRSPGVLSPLDLGVDLGTEEEERWVEVHPGDIEGQLWLAPWFAIWRGGSIVMETTDEQRLMNAAPPLGAPPEIDVPVGLDCRRPALRPALRVPRPPRRRDRRRAGARRRSRPRRRGAGRAPPHEAARAATPSARRSRGDPRRRGGRLRRDHPAAARLSGGGLRRRRAGPGRAARADRRERRRPGPVRPRRRSPTRTRPGSASACCSGAPTYRSRGR